MRGFLAVYLSTWYLQEKHTHRIGAILAILAIIVIPPDYGFAFRVPFHFLPTTQMCMSV